MDTVFPNQHAETLALIQRLGFTRIGLAPQYLMIDGDWRDHVLWQRLNPGWAAD